MVTSYAKSDPFTTNAPTSQSSRLGQSKGPLYFLNAKLLLFVAMLLVATCSMSVHCLPASSDNHNRQMHLFAQNDAKANATIPQPIPGRRRRFLGDFNKPVLDERSLPILFIGEVSLADYPKCDAWFEKYRLRCQHNYEAYLRSQITYLYHRYNKAQEKRMEAAAAQGKEVKPPKPFKIDRHSEDIKRASCCGIWRARDCVVQSIERDRNYDMKEKMCPADLAQQFRQLPNNPTVRAEVLDYCSEYSDGSLICKDAVGSAQHVFGHHLFRVLYIIMAALVVRLVVPRLYLI